MIKYAYLASMLFHVLGALRPSHRHTTSFQTPSLGLTYDICTTKGHCNGSRQCVTLPNPIPVPCANHSAQLCLCQPSTFRPCMSSSSCGNGEVCRINSDGRQVCTSCTAPVGLIPLITVDGVETCDRKRGGRYSFERCGSDEQCARPRRCLTRSATDSPCAQNGTDGKFGKDESCVCKLPDEFCKTSDDCAQGDRCARTRKDRVSPTRCVSCRLAARRQGFVPVDDGRLCVGVVHSASPSSSMAGSPTGSIRASPSLAPSPLSDGGEARPSTTPTAQWPGESEPAFPRGPDRSIAAGGPSIELTPVASPDFQGAGPVEGNGISCIAVEHLGSMNGSALVYRRHRRANVLCDSWGTCATPGHIVAYHGEPMMMLSYCKVVGEGCRWRYRYVNSPRMRRKLRIESNTGGVEFTAFSATMWTRMEEWMLKVIITVGF